MSRAARADCLVSQGRVWSRDADQNFHMNIDFRWSYLSWNKFLSRDLRRVSSCPVNQETMKIKILNIEGLFSNLVDWIEVHARRPVTGDSGWIIYKVKSTDVNFRCNILRPYDTIVPHGRSRCICELSRSHPLWAFCTITTAANTTRLK